MHKRCILKAPAKLNLHLQVGDKRSDGFHDIMSLFIMVDIYDDIEVSSLKTGNDCRIIGSFDCALKDNLIYRAWKEFCNISGITCGAEFIVEKRIPSFAGLGGGSSDAAAALTALNMLFEYPLSDDELIETGARAGSDVPFFLSSAAAVVSGRGDEVEPVTDIRTLDFVVVNPGIEVSTSEAYAWLDKQELKRAGFKTGNEISRIFNGDLKGFAEYTNDFGVELEKRYPVFNEVFDQLYENGAVYCNVSGSGSAVYGLFENENTAGFAAKSLENRYKFVQKIKSLDRIPYAILE